MDNAARYHGYRVHVQVLQWKTLMNTSIKSEGWGWSIVDGRYVSFPTDLDIYLYFTNNGSSNTKKSITQWTNKEVNKKENNLIMVGLYTFC